MPNEVNAPLDWKTKLTVDLLDDHAPISRFPETAMRTVHLLIASLVEGALGGCAARWPSTSEDLARDRQCDNSSTSL